MLNWSLGKLFKENPNGFCAFALRSYVSTAIAQYIDNFVFAIIVSFNFFDWSIIQVLVASFIKMVAELLFEIIFSPLGYVYLKHMEKENIGKEYLDLYQIELKEMVNEIEPEKQNDDEINNDLDDKDKNLV